MRTEARTDGGVKGRLFAVGRRAKKALGRDKEEGGLLKRAGDRGKQAWGNLKDRLPEEGLGSWAADRFDEHPLAFTAGAVAAGIVTASLIPLSDREREGLNRAGRTVKRYVQEGARERLLHLGEAVRDRLDERRQERLEKLGVQEEEPEQRGERRAPARTSARKAAASSRGGSRGKKQPAKQRKRRSAAAQR